MPEVRLNTLLIVWFRSGAIAENLIHTDRRIGSAMWGSSGVGHLFGIIINQDGTRGHVCIRRYNAVEFIPDVSVYLGVWQ